MRFCSVRSLAALVLVAGMSAASNPASPKANTTPKEPTSPRVTESKAVNLNQTTSGAPISGILVRKSDLNGSATVLPAVKPPRPSKNQPQIGRASWYGGRFHGRKTANGESFDMYQFTAAHRSLPLGSWVKVTNLRNHKWVIVRINDRGPWIEGRILDISYGAAQQLDIPARGVERVKIELVEPQVLAQANIGAGTY